ncbi:MAG: peptidoglycan-binding protein [Candidatus Pacebacteria bacterium]|nr:peptidoglycan-binding protein [Candidatus Paceibacterota bacterium]
MKFNFKNVLLTFGIFALAFGFLGIQNANAVASNAATNTDVTPGTQFTTYKGLPVFRLHVNNTGVDPDSITSLSPTPTGSATDTLITLRFYNDLNNNGYVDQGDTDLGASAAFSSDNTKQAFDITDVPVAAGGTASILITAEGTEVGNNNLVFNLEFAAATDIAMSTSPTGTFPMVNTPALTFTTTVPSLTITDGANDPVAPHTATASATNVTVKQVAITAAAGASDSLVSLAPTPTGTENDSLNISSVRFYVDSGSALGQFDVTDIPLETTPATYSANDVRTVFTFSSPVQVAASSTVNILMVYNLGAGVTPANTLYAEIAAVGDVIAGSGTALNGETSTLSSLITISGVAANIAVASAKVNSSNTVLVTMADPGHDLASVDYTKWHIDAGDGGISSLTPASAVVTSAGTPWTVTLTFSGTSFSNTATAYSAALGLYVDGLGVTDTNGDTNAIVLHSASTAITDGQSPVVSSVVWNNVDADTGISGTDTIVVTFNEAMNIATLTTANSVTLATELGLSAGIFGTTGYGTAWTGSNSILTITLGTETTIVGGTTINPTSAVTDVAGNPDATATAIPILDGVAPTVVITDDETGTGNIAGTTILYTFTFSEDVTGFLTTDVVVANGAKGTFTATSATVYTLVVTPTAGFTGNVTVDVAAGVATDGTNGNTIATQSVQAVDMLAPTFTAVRTGLNTFVLTFSETVTSGGVDTDSFTVVEAATVSAGVVVTNTSITLTTTGLTNISTSPAINYVAATGDVADTATNAVANGGAVVPTDGSLPTVAITMSDYAITRGETSVVTFTFSEVPTGFANADVTVENGTLSTVTVDGVDTKIYTATFTPTADISDDVNVITVGTDWTDGTNAPAGSSTSSNYTVSTRRSSSSGGSYVRVTPAVPAHTVPPLADCLAGQLFSALTGRNCNAATPAVVCSRGHIFKATTGERCSSWLTAAQSAAPGASGYAFGNTTLKNGSKGEAVRELQKFLNIKANSGLAVDGQLGPKTVQAIKKWQKQNGLVEDGLVGPKTKTKMHSMAQ